MDRGPIKPQDRLKSIFRRSFPISDLYLPDARSAIPDNRLKTYNGTTYYYDDLGNLIHRELADGEVQNYFYDLHDQLVKAEIFKKDGTKETWAYTYDALGRRIGKGRLKNEEVSDGLEEETGFVWDGSHLLQEVQPDGSYTYLYTDPDSYEPLAQVRNWTNEDGESKQEIHYFHCDQIGIPREMTDKDGNLLWFGNYTGWGKLKSETNTSGTAHQPFRLQNQYADRETGLHYNFFRYYEPDAGRFVNQDPIRLEGGENLYAFGPNVQGWVDSLGLTGRNNTFIHYTDKAGFNAIMQSKSIRPNKKGKTYITDILMTPSHVERDLMIGNPSYTGRGNYAIIFRADPGQMANIKPSRNILEYIHEGKLDLKEILYAGKNPYATFETLDENTKRKMTDVQLNMRKGKC